MKTKTECQCEYCIKCKCGHRADEHLAGVGSCFKCNCSEHSDKSWMALKENKK